MSKRALLLLMTSLVLLVLIVPEYGMCQDGRGMSKWEYYDKICKARGWENPLTKPTGFADRKYGLFDVGKIRLQINNANRLGYSREMITFEYPIGAGITYQWCEALLVGGILNGEKRISNGAIGCYEAVNEQHYEPLPGYDSGVGDNGLAMSNRANSWPGFTGGTWPADAGTVGSGGFPGVYEDGAVAADAEGVWMAVDDDPDCKQLTPLHLKTFGRAMQWSSILADDFIVFKYYLTNTGTETLKDVYCGLHTDMDSPEEGSGEWMDDFAKFISAEDDPVLGNFLYLWDGDDRAAGFIEKNVAWQGVKMLETPLGPDGEKLGLTTLFIATYDDFFVPIQADVYDMLASGISPIHNVDPHSTDWTSTPDTYGPDVTSLHASGPFDLAPGETVTFTFANIFGINKADLMANTTLCQLLYNKNYKTAIPPTQPSVRAVAGDQKVTLYWDAEPSESSVDPLTGNNAFQGYRIYRSDDRGLSWGEPIYNAIGALAGYVALAQCDLVDGITGTSTENPFLNLGDDTGLFHKFRDTNLRNGVEYWYAVCAYDADDISGDLVIPPMENARNTDPNKTGDNTVKVVPQSAPAGTKSGSITGVTHASGNSAGIVSVEVLDPNALVSGTYEVGFESDPDMGTLVKVTQGGQTVMGPVPVTDPDDPNSGQLPVFNGMRLTAVDALTGIDDDATGAVVGDELWMGFWDFEYAMGSGMSDDYEVRFPAEGSIAWQYSDPYGPVQVPYQIWNITTGIQINSDVYDRGDESFDIENSDYIMPTNTAYDPNDWVSSYPDDYNYYFRFSTDSKFNVGDVFRIMTYKPFTPGDTYQFAADATVVTPTEDDLDDIKVVPNPYAITSSYEYSQTPWVKELQFHHLPERCTITIFTVSGEVVRILHHEPGSDGYRGQGVEAWNLWNYNDQEVAFGVYVFHVRADGIGEKLGKFAVIK